MESKPVRIRFFLTSVLPSLVLAILLTPTEVGTDEYVKAYLFLFCVASVLAIVGKKMQKFRLMGGAIAQIWLAPFLPIATTVILESVLRWK